MPIVILSTKTKTEGRAACHILPQRTAPGGTRNVKKPAKSDGFSAEHAKNGTNAENSKFQSGNKQEKIYRKITKKLLQFVKDRVTL